MTPRLLLVHRARSSFVRDDVEILRRHFEVIELEARAPLTPAPWTIVRAVARADIVLCWFASWHAVVPLLLARALGRPGVVIVGGYDVAAMPEIGYGLQRGGASRALSRLALRAAARVVPFSRAALGEARANAGVPEGKLALVPLGVADTGAVPLGTRDIALSVARVDESNLTRKGLDETARTARLLAPAETVIAGEIADAAVAARLRALGGSTLRLAGRVSDAELAALYARAAAYLQLSRHEGFGMSVAEAMRAGCVPVVTRVGSLPELVGDLGEYVASPEEAAAAVRRARDAPPDRRSAIAARIRTEYPLERRAQLLPELLFSLLDGGSPPRR
ncbi:MAG TPA: glycosyltransferase [Candidatus Limnocylindria bacterium]|nr:glycosyltransferase [Candidatus Limnocylindria bacterium]